jgi:hypothetical protein
VAFAIVLVFLQACATVVYKKPDFPEIKEKIKFSKVYKHFIKNFQFKGEYVQKVVIELNGRSIPALGMCSYDLLSKRVALTLLTTTGVKILELDEDDGIMKKAFIMPEMAKKIRNGEKAVQQIADDIKHIYFKPFEQPNECSRNQNSVSLFFKNDIRKTELKFGLDLNNASFVLKEKYFYIKRYPESAVFYYDYELHNGKLIPMRIRYENYLYGYNLTIKNTEVIDNARKAFKR